MGKRIRITENELRRAVNGAVRNYLTEVWVGSGRKKTVMQDLQMWNGMVVLRHDSSTRIKNGVIDHRGKQKNNYSKNSDYGNYFWASPTPGEDQSNNGTYEYYCLVPPDQVYDFEKNEKGYENLRDAIDNEPYVSGRWHDGAIAVMSEQPTPISFIVSNGDYSNPGAIYDAKFHMLRSKVRYGNRNSNEKLMRLMKPYRGVEVPEFLGGYTYEDLDNAEVDPSFGAGRR